MAATFSLDYSEIDNISGSWTFKVTGCVMLSNTDIICEEGAEKLHILDIVDSCSVPDYDFVA